MLYRPARLFMWATSPILRRILFSGKARVLLGIETFAEQAIPDSDAMMKKLESALAELKERSPRHFRLVQNSIGRVAFERGGRCFYHPDLKACVIDARTARNVDPSWLALVLVHEAMHGRLLRAGIRHSSGRWERIESVCVRAELDLAESLSMPPEVLTMLRHRIREPLQNSERTREWRESAVQDYGLPRWLAWLVFDLLGSGVVRSRPSRRRDHGRR